VKRGQPAHEVAGNDLIEFARCVPTFTVHKPA
jgi:hypothetical protein